MKLKAFIRLIRPHQWLKNQILLFPPFLGGDLWPFPPTMAILLPLLGFCAGASAIYIVNDLRDLEQDRSHPGKRQRPLADGRVSASAAMVVATLLGLVALISGWLVSGPFFLYLLLYLVISLLYSFYLKNLPLIELFCVVSGFLLRLLAGGTAFQVVVSDWLFLSVFLLSLYLVCGKRLSELRHEGGGNPALIRPVLAHYPFGFLEGGMSISGAAVLVTYTMYVIRHGSSLWLIPLCCFGLLTYLLRVLSGRGGDPTRALLKEPLLLLVGVIWAALVGWSIYGR
jgi:decaprenyl-phosphate phosphoribosyltransferase